MTINPATIKIVNRKTYDGTGIPIYRPTILCNPYHMRDESERDSVIEKFKKWLMDLGDYSPQWQEIERLYEKWKEEGELTLICYCAPKRCHGEVIKDLLINARIAEDITGEKEWIIE
jgi:hypothetical protein